MEKVEDLMSVLFLAEEATCTIHEVVSRMAEQDIGAVGVLENGRLVGMFSERDLIKKVIPQGLDMHKATLAEVMTSPVITISPTAERSEAVDLMMTSGIRHLPVVNENNDLVGMIGIRDLIFTDFESFEEEAS